MRKVWFAVWAVAGMTAGCAGSANPVGLHGVAASAPKASWTEKASSWTEKAKAPFKKSWASVERMMPSSKPKAPLAAEEPFDPRKATPELYVELAQMSHRSGNVTQARELYQKALAKDPNCLDALLGAARMEDREGRFDVALMLYQRAVAAHPKNATAINDLALCHARRGELAAAHHMLEQAVRLDPQKALYRNNVAKVLVEQNSLQPAMNHLIAVHPPAAANFNMAVLLTETGRKAEAGQYLAQALAIDPRMEPARVMLAQHSGSPGVEASASLATIGGMTTAPALQARQASESILPTPESVATIPWRPSAAGEPIRYPSTDSATPVSSPGAATVGAAQMPALLPPVN
jgi:Tfp pilus assembly protein PilF